MRNILRKVDDRFWVDLMTGNPIERPTTFPSNSELRPWQEYALSCCSPVKDVPQYLQDVFGDRFSSQKSFEEDVMVRCGPIASTTLSLLFRPRIIVEFGVNAGHTSFLLSKLNPTAQVYGVDNKATFHNNPKVTVGYIAFLNNCHNYQLHKMNSWDFYMDGKVDLCFIDADHDEEPVYKDCWRAWHNRNLEGDWCIAFDDYHPSNEGVVKSVDRFCEEVGYPLQKAWSWYFIGSKQMSEAQLSEIEP